MRISELSKPNSVEESDGVADKAIKRLIPATESTISAMNQVRPNWAWAGRWISNRLSPDVAR
jgi:hypothetical protein